MQRFQFGGVEITKVVEWQGEIAPARRIIPGSPHSLWQENRSWLAPDHWHPDTDAYHGAVQTWVLRSEGKTILIDTGVGNDRDRPQVPAFDHLQSVTWTGSPRLESRQAMSISLSTPTSITTTSAGTPGCGTASGCRLSPMPPT